MSITNRHRLIWYRCHVFFFFNDTATTEIYTLSLHDALPICNGSAALANISGDGGCSGCVLPIPGNCAEPMGALPIPAGAEAFCGLGPAVETGADPRAK